MDVEIASPVLMVWQPVLAVRGWMQLSGNAPGAVE